MEVEERFITVRSEHGEFTVAAYFDGVNCSWSDKRGAESRRRRSEKILSELAQKLRRRGTFIGGWTERRRGRRELDVEAKQRRNQAFAETANY